MIIPNRHHKDHASLQSLAHALHTAESLKLVVIAESSLLRVAEFGRDGIACDVWNERLGIGNKLVVLDVESLDLGEWVADELGDDGELFLRVDCHTWAVEARVSHAVRVEIASVGIAYSCVSVRGVSASTGVAVTNALAEGVAGMRCVCSGDGIRFPNIHL